MSPSFLPHIMYGVDSIRNPDAVLAKAGIYRVLDSRSPIKDFEGKFHGNDTTSVTEKNVFKEPNCYNLSKFCYKRKRRMISAILLGAGESKRMGVNKLSLPWGRKTVFEHCFNILFRSKIKEVIVVLSDRSKEIRSQFEKRSSFADKRVKVTMNPHYKRGMSTSIRKGIQVMDPRSQGILIALGDQPLLKTRTVNALIDAFCEGMGEIVVPSFKGEKGHPVIFHRRYKRELLKLKGDMGGRSILQKYPESIKMVPVRSEGVIKDIDTWQEYNPPTRSLPLRRLYRNIGKGTGR